MTVKYHGVRSKLAGVSAGIYTPISKNEKESRKVVRTQQSTILYIFFKLMWLLILTNFIRVNGA